MMMGAPQHIEIFVTHVAEDGPLLKIWGQLDRSAATFVERLILQYTEQFDRGVGVVYPLSLSVDQLCCAKYGEDGVYYRARVADLSAVQQGFVRVNFIDYGNSDVVEISNIRSLQLITSSPLYSVQSQATEFTLAGVVPPMGVGWDQASVEFIREKLCYVEFRCAIVAQISGRRLITLYYNETDFSEILIQKNLAIRITLHAQQAMFHNMQHQFSNVPSYNFSVPPPTVSVNYTNNANMLVKTASIAKQESGVISAPILSVGSRHVIYISNVEDGPNLFAVQLKATENILQNMTQTFSHVPLKPFSQSPIPGSACVSLLPRAKVLCRAVVTNLMEKECVVYCVDFGNTETVPFSQIYEMPSQFLNTKSLAMRFCLAGVQSMTFDDKGKRLFQELVTGETLSLEVVEPEGPPLKQYGNIYLNGNNIMHVLKEKLKDLEKNKAYPQLPAIQPGKFVSATVSYVESVDNFYVQYDANSKALTKIMSTMVEYCTNSAAMIRPNELYIGMPVCALFSVDQLWYRARVLSVTGDQISVFYVDYGNTDTVNLVSLRQMDSNLSQAQAQAVACCLSGFEDSIASLEDLSNRFEEMTLERKLTMKILSRLSNGKFVVELHDTTVAPIVSIGQKLLCPVKTYEEATIDEWHDPASGEPAATQASSLFGKEKSKLEDGGGEGWRIDNKKSGSGWNESRDNSKKWGNRDERSRNDKKWNRDDQDGDQNRWGREEREGNNVWENREERGSSRRGFNKDSDWKDKDNKRGFGKSDDDWKDRDNNKRGFNKGGDDWKDKDSSRRGFNKDDEWKDKDNRRFNKDDDWKDKDNRRFNKDDDWKDKDNRRFNKDDDWKDKDNNRRFNKDDDWKDKDNNRRFNKDDRNWRRRDDQGQEKKWWNHDDRGDSEKKWGSRSDRQDEKKWSSKDDGEDQTERKWGARDNKRSSSTGEYKKWNDGDRGNRRNNSRGGDSWKDNTPSSTAQGWNSGGQVTTVANEEDWGESDITNPPAQWKDSSQAYHDPIINVGTKETVTLVFADSPSNFVIQVDNKMNVLTKMMEDVAALYESGGSVLPENDQKILSPCVARYSEDNAWYRAVITSAPCDSKTEVRFVDYGNLETVPSSDIKEVVPEFLSIPLFGIPCSLFAVQIPVEEWSSDQVTEFLNVADGKKLEAHFIKKEGPLYEVVLTDIEEASSSINEKFGASKSSIEEELFKKREDTRRLPNNSSPLKPSAIEVAYASLNDSFVLPDLMSETRDSISVTWFISPDQFYCQCSSSKPQFTSMVNDIQSAYKGRPPFKGELTVGSPVIAQFPADKVLYRAEVNEIKGSKYQVQYVDYGNVELLAACNIWQIEKRFMELPKQAVECYLSGIKPSENEWPKDSAEFDRLFGAENLECVFHYAKDGKNCVSLSLNGKDVAEELVTCSVAIHKVEERVVLEERLAIKLLEDQQILVHVCFIENVSKFFVHLDPVVAKSIQDKVNKHIMENKDTAPILPTDMVEHQMCLASRDGSQWFRGKIIDTSGTVGMCVTFVDFGDSDDVPVDRIRPIPDALMGFRHQATECCVAGSDAWEENKDDEETFKLEVEAQDVILNIKDIVKGRLSVHLFDIEGQSLELLKNVDKSSPLDIEPLCMMPILTHTVRMWVSHIDSLDNIWLQKESEADILSGLLELLYNFYEEEAKGLELGDPQIDQLCAAKSSKDGSWYRAKVKDITEDQICVIYIDYGNSETLSKDDVKELDPSFYRVCALATCASLAATTQDSSASLTEFEKISAETVFDVSFTKNADCKWSVHLENDDINVIDSLIDLGLVSKVDTLFQNQKVTLPLGEKIDVSISHFESCSEFWVQMDSNFIDILELQQTLQAISPSQATLRANEVGTLCVAQFSDEAWYRARILQSDGTTAKVQFLDYGNAYDADANSLRKLPVKFFHWPFFAVRCRLYDGSFLENVELAEKCAEILSDSDAVFQLQVGEGDDPVLVSLFVGENDLYKAVLERKDAKVDVDESTVDSVSEGVFVSHICSPAKFWVQKENASTDLQVLADSLVQAVNFASIDNVEVGCVYAALFEEDEQWYRAKILEQCDDGYHVLFVDYGNSSIASDLRVLPEEFLNKPFVAKCCQLQLPAGVTSWSAEADKKFVELSGEGTVIFQMNVLSSEEPFSVNLLYDGNKLSDILGELCLSSAKLPASEGDTIGTITHINNLNEFWFHWETESSNLELIVDKLMEAENFDPLEEVSDGLLCVAQFPDDEQWYRARVMSCQEQCIEVFFIDYGNTTLVSEVHSIPQDLSSIPALAKQCSLVLPCGVEKWSEKAEEEFINIFGDGTNMYEISIVNEGDPSVISLKLKGCKVEDILQTFCVENGKLTSSDIHSQETSSSEVEILSETEIAVDIESSTEEKVHSPKEFVLSTESATEIVDNTEMTGVAQNISDDVLENSISTHITLTNSEKSKTHSIELENPCKQEVKDGILSVKDRENESSEEAAHQVLEELIEASTSDCSQVEQQTGELEETHETVALILAANTLNDSDNSNQKMEHLISSKKSEVIPAKHGVEHCEKIIRDFSVELQTPKKIVLPDSNQCEVNAPCTGSPVRKLSHAERIVPGSISRGMSQNDIDLSPDSKEKHSHEQVCVSDDIPGEEIPKYEDISLHNLSNDSQNTDVSEAKDNSREESILSQTLSATTGTEDSKLLNNTYVVSGFNPLSSKTGQNQSTQEIYDLVNENTFPETQCIKEIPIQADSQEKSEDHRISTSYGSEEEKNASVSDPCSDNSSTEPESPSKTLGESTPLSSSVQKMDCEAICSSMNGNINIVLDTSESNSASTASFNSPQKNSQSTEIESEMSGNVSGSLFDDSDSSANCTLMSSSFSEDSKNLGLDESKIKYYQFAQLHASEELYESSKSGSTSSNLPVEKEVTDVCLSEPETSLMEGKQD